MESIFKNPKVFISYSWDNSAHKTWVQNLASQLRSDGIDVTLDTWDALPGTRLTEFMEKAITQNDFVLIICTPNYKFKSDNRKGGVGYEGDIISGEVFLKANDLKYIPILAGDNWIEAAPTYLAVKYYIDLSDLNTYSSNYNLLLQTLYNKYPKAPSLGKPRFDIGSNDHSVKVKPEVKETNKENIHFNENTIHTIKYKYNGTLPILNAIEDIIYANGLQSLSVFNHLLINLKPKLFSAFLYFTPALACIILSVYLGLSNSFDMNTALWIFIILIIALSVGNVWGSLMWICIDMEKGFIVLDIPLMRPRIIPFETITAVEVYNKKNNRVVIKFINNKTIISFDLKQTSEKPAMLILNMVLNYFNRDDIKVTFPNSFLN